MNPSNELLSKLGDYLQAQISLRELNEWILPRIPTLVAAPDSLAGRVTGAIELSMAMMKDGLTDERAIKRSIRRYMRVQQNTWALFDYTHETGAFTFSATATLPQPMLSQIQVWNIEPAGAPV